MHRTAADVRWLFKRASVWERDQTVSKIEAVASEPFSASLSIPDKFSVTWNNILSFSHRNVRSDKLREAVDQFMQIPPDRRVTTVQNETLMAAIEEEDVEWAIRRIERRNAAGHDGLGNDFYQDFAEMVVGPLTKLFNAILEGVTPPQSFLKAVVIPLRKKCDSCNALDYRPISLLTTGYKLFAKILARRLQAFLGQLIGETQQGFVTGRRMDKAVVMMQSIFETYKFTQKQSAAKSGGILFLDFSKAYDSVDRKYLFLVLRLFGFSERFIDLMHRIHDGTTAEFLVNNDFSQPLEVRSGIRQGCPLAPLLFILAMEPLALALLQEHQLQGIQPVQKNSSLHHRFSAFVDDSTILLKHADQVPVAMALVQRFGDLSGLLVQPLKSKFVFLYSDFVPKTWYTLPVLPEGETVRYLGYFFGWANFTNGELGIATT